MADPRRIRTREEWTAALQELFRGAGLSYHVLSERCGGIAASTLQQMVTGQSFPRASTVRLFVQACGESDTQPWVDARNRVAPGDVTGRPPQAPSQRPGDGDPVIATVRLKTDGFLAVAGDPPMQMAPSGTTHVITLEARTKDRAVVLHAARPVVLARRLPRPACFEVLLGAPIPPRRFEVDFDVTPIRLEAQSVDFPLSISATDVEQLWIEPIARTHEVSWQLELDWTCEGRSGTTVINNNGEPFMLYPGDVLGYGSKSSPLHWCGGPSHGPDCPCKILEESGYPLFARDPVHPSLRPYPAAPAAPSDTQAEDAESLKQRVLALDTESISDPDQLKSWPDYRRIGALVRQLHTRPDFRSHEPEAFRALLIRVLRYMYISSQARAGWVIGEKIHADWKRALGEDHPDTLAAANRLVAFLIAYGQDDKVRELFADLLPRCKRTLGAQHPLTVTVESNQCAFLNVLGQHQEAREQCDRVLEDSRAALGADHPATLLVANILVQILRKLGDLQGARSVAEDTLPRYRRTLGDRHLGTRNLAKTLSPILRELGEAERARLLEAELG
jgi:Tetratricopeptide repeat